MFWLFVLASFASAFIAIVRRSWRWMLVSLFLYSPFAWYLDATPRFKGALFILLLHFAAAYFLYRRRRLLAGLLMLPSTALSTFIACIVISQFV